MSRRNFVAGNWKMNCRRESAVELASAVAKAVTGDHCEVALCPPNVYLSDVVATVGGTGIPVGAQNMSAAGDGAFTGEVNAAMLLDIGCKVVILGHSERRQLFGETNAAVAEKTIAALKAGLIPIVCVGETLEERESNQTETVVGTQVKQSLGGVDPSVADKLVIAYEPVWAIGTGLTASPEQAEAVHAMIRKLLGEMFSADTANKIRIQYGGSVKPSNAAELMSQPNIDGALVGGASLKADDFLQIIKAAS
jgi:triosephosphate isomerase